MVAGSRAADTMMMGTAGWSERSSASPVRPSMPGMSRRSSRASPSGSRSSSAWTSAKVPAMAIAAPENAWPRAEASASRTIGWSSAIRKEGASAMANLGLHRDGGSRSAHQLFAQRRHHQQSAQAIVEGDHPEGEGVRQDHAVFHRVARWERQGVENLG